MNIRDVIIIGAGPSGLFAALHLPVHLSVLILEKTEKAAQKLLMSAKGRGNLTNVSINPLQDYVSDDSSFVQQALDHYSSADLLHFLETNNIEYFQEENGKILLKSEKVSQFHDFLLQQLEKKKIEINYGQEFLTLQKQEDGLFQLQTSQGLFLASKVILATGTKSVPDLWTESALSVAKQLNLPYTDFYPALVGFETEKDLSSLSGSSLIATGTLLHNGKPLYQQTWPILFTHRGISGPVVFNASLHIGHLPSEEGQGGFNYKEDFTFKLSIKKLNVTKRFLSYLGFQHNKFTNYTFTTTIIKVRGFDEAKVCGGGILLENLDENFQVKPIPGMYIIGECLNVTGKTWWFNLQRCWTSGYCCATANH